MVAESGFDIFPRLENKGSDSEDYRKFIAELQFLFNLAPGADHATDIPDEERPYISFEDLPGKPAIPCRGLCQFFLRFCIPRVRDREAERVFLLVYQVACEHLGEQNVQFWETNNHGHLMYHGITRPYNDADVRYAEAQFGKSEADPKPRWIITEKLNPPAGASAGAST